LGKYSQGSQNFQPSFSVRKVRFKRRYVRVQSLLWQNRSSSQCLITLEQGLSPSPCLQQIAVEEAQITVEEDSQIAVDSQIVQE
jgi:hypothetical protein